MKCSKTILDCYRSQADPFVELKIYIFEGVEMIRNSEAFDYKEKVYMLESLLSIGAGAGWRPLQITHGALKSFVDNDFKRPKGLERAHQYHRRDTINKLINAQWEGDDWWDWYQDRDYTVLATREENRDESSFKKLAKKDIPPEKSLFRGKRVGYVYGEAEKEFLRNAACELGFV